MGVVAQSELAKLVINVLAGMLAGGVTNAVAVWMLFHPYEKRFGIQGAIPKNKERLARSLGRTVGERLVTPADLMGELSRAGVRDAFEERVAEFVSNLLETERGTLRELLPPGAVERAEGVLEELTDSIAGRVETYIESDDFTERVRAFVARVRSELSRQTVGALVSPEQRERLTQRANEWVLEFSRSPELERGVREYLARHAERVLASNDPLVKRIPPAVLQALESSIENYLPLAATKLGQFLAQPASREKIRDALHGVFQRFVTDLEFHQRIIARLVVTERTFDRALDALERDGVEQLATLLEDENVRQELIHTIREAVLSFLSKPISDVVGDATPERTASLVQTVGDYLLRVLRDERTHALILTRVREVLERAEDRSVGEIMSGVSDDALVRWISEGARSARAKQLLREGLRALSSRALDARLGRPARWLPADFSHRVSVSLAPALWDWMQGQLPPLLQRLNIEALVERKVLSFDTARIEEIIRGVTERELRLIVQLGYVLGAVIGLFTYAVSAIF